MVGRRLKLHVPFWGDWCWGGSNAKKWDHNQKEKIFRNNSIEKLESV